MLAAMHRWLGIAVGIMLVFWFASGCVLSFVPFPVLSPADRLAGAEPIDTASIRVPPQAVLPSSKEQGVQSLRLRSVNGEPRYLLIADGQSSMFSATTGLRLGPLPLVEARAVAQRFAGAPVTTSAGPFELDQWTVHGGYATYRPLYRFGVDDGRHTELYVSATTGEVVQRTTRQQRSWNYVGAVVHWLNPTPLRKNYQRWHRIIWTIALAGVLLVVAGLAIGIIRSLAQQRASRRGLTPFHGLQAWHHRLGLFIGLILLSWVGSGWLSLNMETLFSSDQPTTEQIALYRGLSIEQAAVPVTVEMLNGLADAKQIDFSVIDAKPLLVINAGAAKSSRLAFVADGAMQPFEPMVPDALLRAAALRAWPGTDASTVEHVQESDSYNLRSEPFPIDTRRVQLGDAQQTWVHIDAATGQIVSIYDHRRRVYRWLVDGVHRFDFPLLNRVSGLWHVLLLTAAGLGLAFSMTGVVLAVRRLRRSWRPA
jgi:PepSY-associated TM region